jgi:flagellar basal-body rod modification protein FlgD
MPVSSINSTTTTAAPPPVRQTLGQSDFIRLLTTQMANQDPTDPVDNKETIAQMAQFSSLAGLDQVNETLKSIQTQLAEVLAGQAATNNPAPATTLTAA